MAEEIKEKTLAKIQSELKAPKSQYNNFGKYSYRSTEDILTALKPILRKTNSTLILRDSPILVGDWHYIQATAVLNTPEEKYEITAVAREPLGKKGFDESQITGTASSYARKYALNGMFLIDDTKDADTNGYHQQNNQQTPKHNNSSLATKKKLVTDLYKKIAVSMKTDVNTVRKEAIAQATANSNWEKSDDAGKQAILLRILAVMEKTLVKQ